METRIEKRLEKTEVFPKRMQMMIIDYFEVGHCKLFFLLNVYIYLYINI